MTRKQKRLTLIAGLAVVLGLATFLILTALRDQIVFFFSPTELAARAQIEGPIRVGGLVEAESWRQNDQNNIFSITDGETNLEVQYIGILPDLFREGQGVIAEGELAENGTFVASNVLAKHDENYIPKEVAQTLKDSGQWQGD